MTGTISKDLVKNEINDLVNSWAEDETVEYGNGGIDALKFLAEVLDIELKEN